ncbi:hypothetical protein B296_00009721 [Ensete ventricosum]|uniref:Uncharacterized protein n=1 Tax=Ensete ventricosum TaxID=4639 RepID=A0A427AF95_ENSVE|nr:hypothetical protein B296_00009721 [Ensete ventricosum]
MDRLYKAMQAQGKPVTALLSAKFNSAEEGTNVDGKVEGGGSRHDMESVRQEIQRVVGNRVDGRDVNYDDIPGVGGYHWFYDPFSAAHAAMCLEEEGGVGGLHRWNEGGWHNQQWAWLEDCRKE